MPDEKKNDQTLAEDAVDALEAVGKVTVKGTGQVLKVGIKGLGALGKGLGKGAKKLNEKVKEHKENKKSEEQE